MRKYQVVNNSTREPVDDNVFDRYLAAEKHWLSFDNYEELDVESYPASGFDNFPSIRLS